MAKMYRVGLLVLALLITVSFYSAIPVNAEPTTITVPDDYATISAAIQHASSGAVIKVRAGNYSETSLSINKSISIIGENRDSTFLSFDSPSHIEVADIIFSYICYDPALTVTCNDFRLSGFTITSTGGNIQVDGNRTKIEGNSIGADLFVNGDRIQLSNNQLKPQVNLNGVSVKGEFCNVSANQIVGALYVSGKNNVISQNDVKGAFGIYANTSLVQRNNLHDSSDMITFAGNSNIISRNTIDRYGLGPRFTGTENVFFLNNITRCGMAISPGSGNTIYANLFSKNAWIFDNGFDQDHDNVSESLFTLNNFAGNYNYKLTYQPEAAKCLLDDGKKGNYWSDYTGTDVNGDGIGDTAYTFDSSHVDRYPLIAPFNYSSITEATPDQFLEPKVDLTNPQNTQYTQDNLQVSVVPDGHAAWYCYILDNQNPVAFTGNTTLFGLTGGQHNITVYAVDYFGNTVSPQTVNFTIQAAPTVTYTAVIVVVIVACVGSILYIKKKKKN